MLSFVSLAAPNVFIEFEGKKYYFTALTFQDNADYVLWYQFRDLRIAEQQTKEFDPEERKKILRDTYYECLKKTWNDGTKDVPLSIEAPEIQESMNTMDGISYQNYLSLRHKHPEITEELSNKIVSLVTYQAILPKLLLVQGLANSGEDESGEVKTPVKIKRQLTGVRFIDTILNWGNRIVNGRI